MYLHGLGQDVVEERTPPPPVQRDDFAYNLEQTISQAPTWLWVVLIGGVALMLMEGGGGHRRRNAPKPERPVSSGGFLYHLAHAPAKHKPATWGVRKDWTCKTCGKGA
jgi:hypothetical protein